jgi:hypothetical protein
MDHHHQLTSISIGFGGDLRRNVEQRVKNRGRAGGWYSVAAHAAASSLLLSTLFTGHGGRRRRASPIMSSLSCAPVQYTPLVTSWHTAHYCNLQVSGRRVRSAGRSQASYHTSKIPARPYTSGLPPSLAARLQLAVPLTLDVGGVELAHPQEEQGIISCRRVVVHPCPWHF